MCFLIFKEILNNVVRHADATTVTVAVTIASRQLHLTVTDDGRGFDVAAHRRIGHIVAIGFRLTAHGAAAATAPGATHRRRLPKADDRKPMAESIPSVFHS